MYSLVTLKDIGKIITGKTPKTSDEENYGDDYMFIGPTDLHQHYIITKSTRSISSKGYTSIKNNTLDDGLSILVGCIGWDLGNVGIVKQKCATNQQINSITNIKKEFNGYYIYYWFKTKKDYLFQIANVTRTPILNKSRFSDIKVRVPKKKEQDKVAEVLCSLDAKIDLNNKINAELEAMAKLIYDYWFVQFDFPTPAEYAQAVGRPEMEGKPYKSSGGKMVYDERLKREIPEGWKSKELNKLLKLGKEQVNPSLTPEKEFKHLSIPVFDSTGTYKIEKGSEIGSNKFTISENDLAVSKLNPWFSRVFYPLNEKDLICTTEMVVWKCMNEASKNFFYQLATSKHFIAYCTQNATGTSNSHKRVNPTIMMQYKSPFSEVYIKSVLGNFIMH